MPRSEMQSKVYPQTHHSLQSTMPRMSYTGPLMPRPTPNQSSNPSVMQTVKEGFSFGVGASIARNFVDRMFGSSGNTIPTTSAQTTPAVPKPTPSPITGFIEPVAEDQLLYHKCMQEGDSKSLVRHEYCKNFIM